MFKVYFAVAVAFAVVTLSSSVPVLCAAAADGIVGLDLGASARRSQGSFVGEGHEKALDGAILQLVHQGHEHVHATGTVNSVDLAHHKVNISHGPISQIGWPAMTMDFVVASTVDLNAVKPGTHVDFTLEQGDDGQYQVESLKMAGEGK